MTPVKIEILKAEYGDRNSQRDVTEMLKKDVGDFPEPVVSEAKRWTDVGVGDRHSEEPEEEQRQADLRDQVQSDERADREEGEGHRQVSPDAQHAAEQDPPPAGERVQVTDRKIVPTSEVPRIVRHVRTEVDRHRAEKA